MRVEIVNSREIAEFISHKPLYSKLKLGAEFKTANKFWRLTFQFYCEIDEGIETFELDCYHQRLPFRDHLNTGGLLHWKDKNDEFALTQHYKGICKRCNKYHIDVILNTFAINGELFVRKVGQYPPFEITPERFILKYLNEEDKDNYKKALLLLSQSYGIGAYSYLRRIVENEILNIINDLSNLDFPGAENIGELLEKYEQNHQMSNLIEGVNEFLPETLKSLGNNPIKVLYSQLSGGIHSFSEEECLEKAKNIDTLLKFVIKKINEEKSEIRDARDAMDSLSS